MKHPDPASFGEIYAEDYDRLHDPGTTDAAVDLLADLARGRKTLELAIGTGRVALPLAKRGIEVHGFDASPDMIAKLKEKPGGDQIPTTIADMADFSLTNTYDFAFLVFNTLFNLTTEAGQISCFKCVSEHLRKGGQFLIETYIPDLSEFTDNQFERTRQMSKGVTWFETALHNPADQTVEYHRYRTDDETRTDLPLHVRYAWPSEIDLMAELAGMKLIHRWGGWACEPFTPDSRMHISLYEMDS